MATEDSTQRLKENPPDPLEDIRQEHESWLAELEGLAVEAIATNDWSAFYAHVVDFQNEFDLHGEASILLPECLTVRHSNKKKKLSPFPAEVSADELHTPSADPFQTTES